MFVCFCTNDASVTHCVSSVFSHFQPRTPVLFPPDQTPQTLSLLIFFHSSENIFVARQLLDALQSQEETGSLQNYCSHDHHVTCLCRGPDDRLSLRLFSPAVNRASARREPPSWCTTTPTRSGSRPAAPRASAGSTSTTTRATTPSEWWAARSRTIRSVGTGGHEMWQFKYTVKC